MGQKYIGWLHRNKSDDSKKPDTWSVRLNYMNTGEEFKDGPMINEYATVQEAIDKTEFYLGFRLQLDETIDQFMGYRIRWPVGGFPLRPQTDHHNEPM